MWQSEQHQRVRLAPPPPDARTQRLGAAAHCPRPHPPVAEYFFEDAAVGGVVVHDQHRQPVQVRASALAGGGGAPAPHRPNRAVKWNALPWPCSLSTQMRPPIIDANCDEIVRPRPVPPYLRVVE